jgi:hypothetical protein
MVPRAWYSRGEGGGAFFLPMVITTCLKESWQTNSLRVMHSALCTPIYVHGSSFRFFNLIFFIQKSEDLDSSFHGERGLLNLSTGLLDLFIAGKQRRLLDLFLLIRAVRGGGSSAPCGPIADEDIRDDRPLSFIFTRHSHFTLYASRVSLSLISVRKFLYFGRDLSDLFNR